MKLRPVRLFAAIALCIVGTPTLFADTVRLKNGSSIEGKIIAETLESVTIEYGGGVKETKVISRTEIIGIRMETPDEAAYAMLQKRLPTADMLTEADYAELLGGELAVFETRYKDSRHLDDVKAIIAKLKEEQAKAAAGGIKIEGRWITGADATRDPYNHSARLASARMKQAAKSFDFHAALSEYETLEKEHFYSRTFPAALTAGKAMLAQYDAALVRMQRENQAIMEERETNLKSMDANLRTKTVNAFNSQMAAFNAKRDAAREAGRTWLAISKWDATSLEEARATIAAEKERLATLDLEAQAANAPIIAGIYQSIADGDAAAAARQAATAKENKVAGPTVSELITKVQADAKAAEETKIAAEEAEKAAKLAAIAAMPAVPEKEGDPAMDDKKDDGKEEEKSVSTEEPTSASDEDEEESADEDDESSLPFSTLLIILAGILILVTVLAKVFGKSADEDEE